MSDYKFEIFFSYKRNVESDKWHEKVADKLKFWLGQELKKLDVKVFFDTQNIKSGDQWKERISDGLKKSKCLVAIWSPYYFLSQWCVSEWKTFLAREDMLGLEKGGLIVPAAYNNGENFPEEANEIQSANFNDYISTIDSFWNTNDAVYFEKEKLRTFASDIAKKVRAAPKYSEDFPEIIVPKEELATQKTINRVASEDHE